MKAFRTFQNYIHVSFKRLMHYLPPAILSVLLLLFLTSQITTYLANHLYKEQTFGTVKLGYYLPPSEENQINNSAISMVEEMQAMKETIELVKVSSIDEGKKMLEQGDILYLVLIPEQFVNGIMDGTNTPLEIIVHDNSSLRSYITNELFMSYASCLGIAQAGLYTAYDVMRAHGYEPQKISAQAKFVDLLYLERFLNKEAYESRESALSQKGISLIDQYLAFSVMISLMFMSMVLMPLFQQISPGVNKCLQLHGCNTMHILISNFLVMFVALIAAYIPCHIAVSIYAKQFHADGFILVLPALLLMALFLVMVATWSKNAISANMTILFTTLFFAYMGGGLLPNAMLPNIVKSMSHLLPGSFIHQCMCQALF